VSVTASRLAAVPVELGQHHLKLPAPSSVLLLQADAVRFHADREIQGAAAVFRRLDLKRHANPGGLQRLVTAALSLAWRDSSSGASSGQIDVTLAIAQFSGPGTWRGP